jgi:hypothetical protein
LWKWLDEWMHSTYALLLPSKFQCKFPRNTKFNPKIHMEVQKCWMTKAVPSKKGKASDIKIPNFKLYYRTQQ